RPTIAVAAQTTGPHRRAGFALSGDRGGAREVPSMLRGELVNLRAIEPGDAATAWRWINDPEVTRFISARYPMSLGAEQAWAEGRAKGNTYGNAVFAVEVAATGQYIGGTGLHDARPEE